MSSLFVNDPDHRGRWINLLPEEPEPDPLDVPDDTPMPERGRPEGIRFGTRSQVGER